MLGTGQTAEIEELGYFGPEPTPAKALETGEVGYIMTGVKDVAQVRVGDTIVSRKRRAPSRGCPATRSCSRWSSAGCSRPRATSTRSCATRSRS